MGIFKKLFGLWWNDEIEIHKKNDEIEIKLDQTEITKEELEKEELLEALGLDSVDEMGELLKAVEEKNAPYEHILWEWKTVPGHPICPTCEERNGQKKTYDEWLDIGTPCSEEFLAVSECGKRKDGCYCVLDCEDEVMLEAQKNDPNYSKTDEDS